jgi:tRNA (guanine37-N1)-methyltransferase
MITFHIVSIFPNSFTSYFKEGIIFRAIKNKKIKIVLYDLRDFSKDKHRKVDDTPYGGGPGMVLAVEPIYECVSFIKKKLKSEKNNSQKIRTILFSAKGTLYKQKKASELKDNDHLILICGRYEGVDERVAKKIADEELSIGEYVLTGGELPAMVMIDSISRLLPGILGNEKSLESESYGKSGFDYSVYTRPEIFKNWKVPKILLGGNHLEIEKWRNKNRKNDRKK